MTDINRGSKGAGKRMAYLFDASRVELSGLAGELVVPPEWLAEIAPSALHETVRALTLRGQLSGR